jgi:tetratricopeptide (TPR) repeat protein
MKLKFAMIVFVMTALAGILAAQQTPPAAPLTEKEVIHELKKKTPPETLIQTLSQRGVDFDLTPEIEKKLRKAKADDEVIAAVKNAGPTARKRAAEMQTHGVPSTQQGPQVSPEEAKAYIAIRDELDPNKTLALASDFEKNYPNSQYLTWVYAFAARAAQQKSDVNQVVELDEKSLKLNPDNIMSLAQAADIIPQPQYLGKQQGSKEALLTQAEGYANEALKLIDQASKQANETDEAFQKRKTVAASGIHASLGMIHLQRALLGLQGADKDELAKAEKEYTLAISTEQPPDPRDCYRLGETYKIDGKTAEAIDAFTKAAQYGQGTAIQQFADKQIAELKAKK